MNKQQPLQGIRAFQEEWSSFNACMTALNLITRRKFVISALEASMYVACFCG